MARFELISKYEGYDSTVNLFPRRKTAEAAGYDFFVAEDTIIMPYSNLIEEMAKEYVIKHVNLDDDNFEAEVMKPKTLDEIAALTKEFKTKPTLVPTGVKAKLDPGTYLELSVRSSCPLKYWLIMANSVGIIDGDYYNNPDNEGHIYFQIINLSPLPIILKKGDCIGQGIIKPYLKIEGDNVTASREGGFGSTDK